MADFFRPDRLADALTIRSRTSCQPLAGGTDLFPAASVASAWSRPGPTHPDAPATLDLSALRELRGIRQYDGRIEIGALTTWREALDAPLPAWFDGVRLAAREVGGAQIQNRATLAGNLCNASPAADGVPALLALDAGVRLQRLGGQREMPLSEFLTGNRRTGLAADELLTAILIPRPDAADTRATFLKLGARRYLVISIAMTALTLGVTPDGRIAHAAIAVGACSAVAQRLPALERRLVGLTPDGAAEVVEPGDVAALTPLSDQRASAGYRRAAAATLVRRGLRQLAALPARRAA